MKKSELIAKLNEIEGDPRIIVSRDEEGNGYNDLRDIVLATLDADGEPIHPDEVDDLAPENAEQAIVIWP